MPNLKVIQNPDTKTYAAASVAVYNNGGFCPCLIDRNDNTKCPCKEFREQETEGLCTCGRYMKVRREE